MEGTVRGFRPASFTWPDLSRWPGRSDLRIIGIEQNPATSSRWAALAEEGKRIMQFRCKGCYVANVCEGKLLRYPAWGALKLPD